ncbi:hydroxyisourate hydrolase [Aestuariicella hydrocarbonica]|uniref:5-hydroxyisourate hydrolase n=1 Tax=Pseudomaricurvus hydrocarbonicus TaxID=1470433 RepID=A0A9E5ML20_9GAMM|nr:hydroxyisourate hydrolase [Aestuariicella hydrocarbonica]NHO66247.1 hydroxyisourate hydrolase [Aestuariicella hydrocarbonica]
MSQITTHVLDTSLGTPAEGIDITLAQLRGDDWFTLGTGTTNSDGRLPGLCPEGPLPAGTYRMHFATAVYFQRQGCAVFYPYVDVVFCLDDSGQHYHVPLLLSPFGYSTYRGS